MRLNLVGLISDSKIINGVFERYMQGQGCALKSYNVTNAQFDVQYAATHCAIQMPWLREFGKVIVKY